METTYTYSLAADFDGTINQGRLANSIRTSSITKKLDSISVSGDVVKLNFLDGLSSGEISSLAAIIAAHDGTPSGPPSVPIIFRDSEGNSKPIPLDADGNLKFVAEPLSGTKLNIMSINWCNKCSWYEGSIAVVDEVLTDSGNGLSFNSAHAYWIDMTHGRVTGENKILADNAEKWLVAIHADAVLLAESLPDTTTMDYQVNYQTGIVTFNSSQAGKEVKASYWYASTGTFTVKPVQGKKLKLLYVEVQFSVDIVLNDTMIFTPFGYAGAFAPQYVPVPYAATDKIPLQSSYLYKTRSDYVNESNGTYPLIKAFGGSGWRGGSQDIITLPWRYLTRTDLFSSAGMEIRIEMAGNIPHGGETATATFYCISDDE